MYQIDKHVPFEPVNRGPKRGTTKYPWPSMGVGDSVFFQHKAMPDGTFRSQTHLLQNAKNWANAARLRRKFSVRHVEGGVRIWRTE